MTEDASAPVIEHAWLQKHPTPAAQAGEFHWYPSSVVGDELRAALVERLAGTTAGAVLWRIAPGEVAWAQTFAAIAPTDGRRYTGIALVLARGERPTADLLSALVPLPAAPWSETAEPPAPPSPDAPLPDDAAQLAAIARALISGGSMPVASPALVARVERMLPSAVQTRPRWGSVTTSQLVSEPVGALCAAALLAPSSRAATAWQLACTLATSGRSLDDVFANLTDDPAWRATLHAWGRGRVEASADQLADRLAHRVLAELVADRDPAPVIAEARWYAILPAWRRDALLTALAERAPLLEELSHA